MQGGHRVAHLGRTRKSGAVPSFVWDMEKREMDPHALDGIDVIVHLAGAGVADKRWSPQRKQEIRESRTRSSGMLFETLKHTQHNVKAVVSASAIGYYGFGLDSADLTEESNPGDDYLARVVVEWEKEVERIAALAIRVATIRIGIVLSDKGGALKKMAAPVRWGCGAPLGTGNQIVSWIHIEDLCSIFIQAIADKCMIGTYNAVGPHPVTNREMTQAIAHVMQRPLWLPPVPSFVLHILLGEMADIIINGSHVSAARIERTGFKFQFPELEGALSDLLKK